jgi:hypothetical protein
VGASAPRDARRPPGSPTSRLTHGSPAKHSKRPSLAVAQTLSIRCCASSPRKSERHCHTDWPPIENEGFLRQQFKMAISLDAPRSFLSSGRAVFSDSPDVVTTTFMEFTLVYWDTSFKAAQATRSRAVEKHQVRCLDLWTYNVR